jgi:hypothetical protein
VFEKIAQSLNAKLTNEVLFEISDFNDAHEEEVQYTIGPFTLKQ